jgi:hypothetical protein
MVLLLLLTGCHAKNKVGESGLSDQDGRVSTPGKMAALGKDTITTECEHESYANASKGLIVEEAGLHVDVFSLRDRDSLTATAYTLDEALRLEELLRGEAKVSGHSAEQAACIDAFAQHFGTLTDALVQADKVQRELDISAFKEATKEAEAEDQFEKQPHKSEQPTAPGPR